MRTRANTIIDLLRRHAASRGDETSFVFLSNGEAEQGRISFLDLQRRAEAVASELAARSHQRVVLMLQPGLDFIATFFGCLAAGIVAVPIYPPKRAEECAHSLRIAQTAGASLVITDRTTQDSLVRFGASWTSELPIVRFDWLDAPDEVGARAELFRPHPTGPDDIAFLQFTSGSTGDPKGVIVTHANIVSNEEAIQLAFQHDDRTTVLGWLPFYHDMGLLGNIMQPVYLGRPCILMPPAAFVQKPIRWIKAMSRYRATTSGGPNFAYDLCIKSIADNDLERFADLDLSHWTVAFSGAEPVRAETLERFAEKFGPYGFSEKAFFPCYGMAETTLMLTAIERPRAPLIVSLDAGSLSEGNAVDATVGKVARIVSCGRTWGPHDVIVVDPRSGKRLPDDAVGEVWASGPSIASGYWNQPAATREQFQAVHADFPGKHFLRTGDLGFLRQGELYLTGRMKTLLIINGRNYYPSDIEATVARLHPAFRPQTAVFSEDDMQSHIVLVQEVYKHLSKSLDVDSTIKLVQRAVLASHGIKLDEVVLTTSRIPVTTSGKVRRGACQQAWRSGRLAPITAR